MGKFSSPVECACCFGSATEFFPPWNCGPEGGEYETEDTDLGFAVLFALERCRGNDIAGFHFGSVPFVED